MFSWIGTAVGTLVALGFSTPAVAQDAPPLQRPPRESTPILDFQAPDDDTVTFSGSLRLEFFARDSAIEELRSRVSGLPAPGDDTFLDPDARLRLDLKTPDLRLAAELAVLPYDDRSNLGLGGADSDARLWQLYADLDAGDFTFRAGAFEYAWRIRPHGEPFLLALGRAESFFSGPADRDVEQAAGALVKWRAGDFVEVEALWMTAIEGGPAAADESPVAALVNFPLSERSAFFLGALRVSGAGSERVTTWGGGTDWYFGDEREIELFGEAWVQRGRIAGGVSRRAWAAHGGARTVIGPWRAELSASRRSGDDDPADGTDETFQSYEGQERLRIVESAEFGLDWDVNVSAIRLSIARRIGDSFEARLDAARFRLVESMSGVDRDLGLEADATTTLDVSRAVSCWLALAALWSSDALTDDAFLVAAGVRALW